jgi:hypothetical protein
MEHRLTTVVTAVPVEFASFGTALACAPASSNFANHFYAMIRHFSLTVLLMMGTLLGKAQTCDLVFFTDDGTKFTLVIDGDVKNSTPATRVVATGIRNETPVVMVNFEDASIPALKKPGYFPLGMEYTVMITTNKKGERVLRPSGEAALGTAAKAEPEKPKPAEFTDDAPVKPATTTQGVQQTTSVGGVQQVTTVTVVEEEGDMDMGTGSGTGENVNISMGVNGVGLNMNVNVTEGGSTTTTTGGSTTRTTTTRTTTTTTTTGGSTTMKPADVGGRPAPEPVKEPEVYRMPGYSGKIGCSWPMTGTEFAEAKKSIEAKSFEDTKKTLAMQIVGDRCLTVDQVKEIMGTFSFEDTKLEFAKFAYDHTYDISNYYKLSDAFSFESSMEELNEYVRSR